MRQENPVLTSLKPTTDETSCIIFVSLFVTLYADKAGGSVPLIRREACETTTRGVQYAHSRNTSEAIRHGKHTRNNTSPLSGRFGVTSGDWPVA